MTVTARSVTTRSATARTDVPAPGGIGPALSPLTVRRFGTGLTVGAVTWAVSLALYGFNPDASDVPGVVAACVGALAFQAGLYLLLTVQRRTGAVGTGRLARAFVVLEHVLLAGAVLNTLDPVLPFLRGTLLHGIFDACWPLSMLGMFAIGVRIAIKGRWRGALRFWPLVAESWAVVTVPASGLVPGAAGFVGAGHLVIGYATLGVLLARRPHLVLQDTRA